MIDIESAISSQGPTKGQGSTTKCREAAACGAPSLCGGEDIVCAYGKL